MATGIVKHTGGDGLDWALEPSGHDELKRVASWVADMRIGNISDPRDAAMRMMYGRRLGLCAMQSVMEISLIKGKWCASAKCLLAKCRQHPDCEYFTLVESTDQVATFKTKRRGDDEVRLSFTIEDAQKMGLASNDNYRKQPATMLMWRCAMKVARPVYPDALMGFYANEEMGDAAAPADEFVVTPEPPRVAVKPAPVPPPSDVKPVEEREAETPTEAEFEEADDPAHDLPPEPTLEQLEQSFMSSIALVTTKAALESVYSNAKYSGIDEDAVKRIYRAVSLRLGAINGKKAG